MKKTLLCVIAMLFVASLSLRAVPASPYPIDFKQPNGDVVTVVTKGDECFSWQQTVDGYTLMFDNNGYLTYAFIDKNGDLKPSNIIATQIEERSTAANSFLLKLEKGLFYSQEQIKFITQIWDYKHEKLIEIEKRIRDKKPQKSENVVGNFKTVCALVQFPELSFTKTKDDFERLINQINYTDEGAAGSVRDFFKEVSYDKFDLEVTLIGPYTAPESESYYTGENGKNSNCPELAQFLLDEVDKTIDFSEYDSNGDDIVDGFHFIFAGYGQEANTLAGLGLQIWSHKWAFKNVFETGEYCEVDGKYILYYSCSPELRGNTETDITHIGVIAHEMSHAFGAPDFYDTDYESGGLYVGTGYWDIMAGGSWNDGGRRPAHHNMYQKIWYGWVNPIELKTETEIKDMPNSAENPVAYIVKTAKANEYFILENRQQIKFDVEVPGHGLLIYRVSADIDNYFSSNSINATHPQKMYPVCASAESQIPTVNQESYGYINSDGCPFPGSTQNILFTDSSTPSAKSWNKANSNKPITDIVENEGMISFYFMKSELPQYTITITQSENGTLTVSNNNIDIVSGTKVDKGTVLKINTTPATDYILENIYVNGIEIQGNTITVNTDITISASFIYPDNVSDLNNLALKVYPNPATDIINIEGELETIEIYSISGKLEMTIKPSDNSEKHTIQIDISHLTAGMYIVKTDNDKIIKMCKIIK